MRDHRLHPEGRVQRPPVRAFEVLTVGALALGLLSITLHPKRADADVIIRTEWPETELVADGQTEYQLNVRASTTEIPGMGFSAAEWDVADIPTYFTITGAVLPSPDNPSTNPDDFFFDYYMDPAWNRVDGTVSGGELDDNVRLVNNVREGPSDVDDKLLGIYTFTVNIDAPPGEGSFDLNDVAFMDTDLREYNTPDGGSGVRVLNDTYNIVAPRNHPRYEFEAFLSCVSGPNSPYDPECDAFDFDVDGDVDFHDFGAWQATVSAG